MPTVISHCGQFFIRGSGDSPFFFFVVAWLGLCYHFFCTCLFSSLVCCLPQEENASRRYACIIVCCRSHSLLFPAVSALLIHPFRCKVSYVLRSTSRLHKFWRLHKRELKKSSFFSYVENEYCFSKTLLSLCPNTYKAP